MLTNSILRHYQKPTATPTTDGVCLPFPGERNHARRDLAIEPQLIHPIRQKRSRDDVNHVHLIIIILQLVIKLKRRHTPIRLC